MLALNEEIFSQTSGNRNIYFYGAEFISVGSNFFIDGSRKEEKMKPKCSFSFPKAGSPNAS